MAYSINRFEPTWQERLHQQQRARRQNSGIEEPEPTIGQIILDDSAFNSWYDLATIEIPNYTPRMSYPEFINQFGDRFRQQSEQAIHDALRHETGILSVDTSNEPDRAVISPISYQDLLNAQRQLKNQKETSMTQHLKFNKTYTLLQIFRPTRISENAIIRYVYENDIEFSTDSTLRISDFENNKQRIFTFHYIDEEGNVKYFDCRLEFIIQTEEALINGMNWSNTRTNYIRFNQTRLLEGIRNRYAFFDRPRNGLSNIVIDNYAPKLMYLTNLDQGIVRDSINLPKTIYAISPWFAQYFGAHLIPTEQLCRVLGYDLKTLKNLIIKVKRKDYTVTFVGYGGTVVNTIYWLTEIMKATQSVNLFKAIEIFEPDTLEISNLLRFPKNPYIENNIIRSGDDSSKLKLLSNDEISLLSRTKVYLHDRRIDGNNISRSKIGQYYDYTFHRYKVKDNHIFYGAPNIDTRTSFQKTGHFISATHNGNDAHLWLNPTQDADLQVESYGLIQLTPFFMNQLRLAIGFLETLATDDLNLLESDKLLMEYSFDGEAKLSTNRTYNFQLENHDGTVTTEEEAANAW